MSPTKANQQKNQVVFQVTSKCSKCGSVLRAYDKKTKQTSCFDCGKKQPPPKIDIESLEFDDNRT